MNITQLLIKIDDKPYIKRAIRSLVRLRMIDFDDDISKFASFSCKQLLTLPAFGATSLKELCDILAEFKIEFKDKPVFYPRIINGQVKYFLKPIDRTKKSPQFIAGMHYAISMVGAKSEDEFIEIVDRLKLEGKI